MRDLRWRYAVVRECRAPTYPYSFSAWHDTKDEAVAEAERLVRKEHAKFYVLKLVGIVQPDVAPVKKEVWE